MVPCRIPVGMMDHGEFAEAFSHFFLTRVGGDAEDVVILGLVHHLEFLINYRAGLKYFS